ncbi:MAG: RluA family pseudouridine synthase [Alphaproteobacteria bacterium]|nr:RluA family pseudouridine synthase [Alphaproteobacteria bacterium]
MSIKIITVAEDDDGQRFDRWVKKYAPEIPYGLAQKLIRKGGFRVDGKRVKADSRLKAGQEVRIPPHEDKPADQKPRVSKFDSDFIRSLVIYDDGDVMALNKPYGLPSQGGSKVKRHIDGMLDALADKNGVRPRLVHRLDKDTSGVLLLARSAKVAKALGAQFKSRDIKKIYWAIVSPAPQDYAGTIKAPLAKAGGSNKERMVVDKKEGKMAITEFEVVEHALDKAAFVAFWPRTGRTHQIRVHAELIDCPIVGDTKYKGIPPAPGEHKPEPQDLSDLDIAQRLHLHARQIICQHPTRKGTLNISAPLPDDLKKSWKALGFDPNNKSEAFENI